MKILILILLLLAAMNIMALEIKHNDKIYNVTLENLQDFTMYEFDTIRDKDGVIKNDSWKGILLSDLLTSINIINYDLLKLASEDNYQIRITANEVADYDPILALHRNGKKLSENKIRLVGAKLRDMFWIQGISHIETEACESTRFPHTIYFAEAILANTPLHKDLAPFTNITGYRFGELTSEVFPNQEEELILIGRDGIQHRLKYSQFLAEAVLELCADGGYKMKSPQMPAGMWIKNLGYIQGNDKVIIFRDQFENIQEISELLNWENFPETGELKSTKLCIPVSTKTPFSNKIWKDAVKFVW